MYALKELVGVERPLETVGRCLYDWAHALGPSAVGAHQINCSDECERECVEAFDEFVVRTLLPKLKYSSRSSFRTANLGSRYEPGSIPIAEEHYSSSCSESGFKVLLVKLNTHVSLVGGGGEPLIFGQMERYEQESAYCGALHALLDDTSAPFVKELRETMQDGMDRLGLLRDPTLVAPNVRALFTAVVAANLQSLRASNDVLAHESHSPTLYLIVPAVTLNRPSEDAEIIVGLHLIDDRDQSPTHEYFGLGSDPRRYRIRTLGGRVHIEDR